MSNQEETGQKSDNEKNAQPYEIQDEQCGLFTDEFYFEDGSFFDKEPMFESTEEKPWWKNEKYVLNEQPDYAQELKK